MVMTWLDSTRSVQDPVARILLLKLLLSKLQGRAIQYSWGSFQQLNGRTFTEFECPGVCSSHVFNYS